MNEPFEIRRRTGLYAGIGLAALALAIAFGVRAYREQEYFLWILVAVLAVMAFILLISALDARTPLFVADEQGVRMRNGNQWVGFRWQEMGDIRIVWREGFLHDPRVKVLSSDGLRIYNSPVGFTTTASPVEAEVQLARRRQAAAY